MPPTDASVLTNLFPYADRVETRAGFTVHATASSLSPTQFEGLRYLMKHSAGGGADSVFVAQFMVTLVNECRILSVAANGTLSTAHDLTVLGSGTPVNGVGEWTQFGSASGTNYLMIAAAINGAFQAVAYDGSTWTHPSITGVPFQTFGCHSHQKRLWFYNNAFTTPLSAYYLPVGAVSGAVQEFNMAPFATKGGRIIAMRTVTRDGGSGSDDLALFLTNRGEAIVYAGTNPASLATWSLVGVFDISLPAAARSGPESDNDIEGMVRDSYALEYGGDVLLMLQTGLVSANAILSGTAISQVEPVSAKIQPLLTTASEKFTQFLGTDDAGGWKLAAVPLRRQLIIALPTAVVTTGAAPVQRAVTSDWYVMNTETGAWCKFQGLNSRDMIVVDGKTVYFIDGGLKIYKYDGTATADNGTTITYEARGAYNYFNSPNNKLVTLMQPMLRSTGDFSVTVRADADFNAGTIASYTSYTVSVAQNLQPWLSPSAYGRAIATHIQGQTSVGVVSWYATNYAYESSGLL